MKKILFTLLIAAGMMACSKYQEITDANYPAESIYMPAARSVYQLRKADTAYAVPGDGNTYTFRVDMAANKVIIPLGVARGGLTQAGVVHIDISARPDTVNTLITAGTMKAELLPAEAYTVPVAVQLDNGARSVPFEISVDRQFLLNNAGKAFAAGVGINSKDRMISAKLGTTVIVIPAGLIQ